MQEQIRYGDYCSKLNQRRIEAAITTSGFKSVLQDLPRGLETHAGKAFAMPEDEAILFSGGHVQLLAITRTLYRHARIYLLDEPTSHVDPEKEERFFQALPAATQDKAVLFVSHRFSTLRRAERILVMDQGRIIEDGTHEELVAKRGRYSELFTMQAKSYE